MTIEEITAGVARNQWRHRIDLGNGILTPGNCDHGQTEEEISARWGLPADLSGKSVLDVGCWDGLFSLACLRRGASSVAAVDLADRRATFDLVMEASGFGAKTTFSRRDAQECLDYHADVVLCFGVLYHVERPLEVIRNCVAAAEDLVIIETALAAQVQGPTTFGLGVDIRWVQKRGHDNDPSNVWYPTPQAVLDAMRVFGCIEARQIHREPDGFRGTFIGRKKTP